MKTYPSIPGPMGSGSFRAHIFDKYDGSNLRFEWSKKRGWYKFGCRNRLFDSTDLQFGDAVELFEKTLAEDLERIAHDSRWDRFIVFAEYWGRKSFAGFHHEDDPKQLTVFDINPHKKGILGPVEFRKLLEGRVPTPMYHGEVNWTRGFIQKVREGGLAADWIQPFFEGVVGKAGTGHKLKMAKAKTQVWVDEVKNRYTADQAEKIINS